MGTRYEDQPPELWAGPESLDPTPVWKQFALIGLLLLGTLALVVLVSLAAIAPQLVAPPALVPGERLVLAAGDVPVSGAAPRLVGPPLVDDAHSFWLARVGRDEVVAYRARWSESFGAQDCAVAYQSSFNNRPVHQYAVSCGDPDQAALFDETGAPVVAAGRGLDRYLVSVSGDRVIVNLSRLIVSPERTSAPTPP